MKHLRLNALSLKMIIAERFPTKKKKNNNVNVENNCQIRKKKKKE